MKHSNVEKTLAPYAVTQLNSRGRRFFEDSPSPLRTDFQRDRDRIIHSSAFRRLEYKTQVFINHEGDMFRTRLTHSLEVAQIARTIARYLNVNEDLTEAIAIAHDLGHTPFGHAGQDALHQCMLDYGGFEHNLQSLRIVDELEERYAAFKGLNLMFETREGILKHCALKHAKQLGDIGERFVNKQRPSIEAQIANLADEIAYNNHDIDDGLRSGLLQYEQLKTVDLFAECSELVQKKYPQANQAQRVGEIIRRMIHCLIEDLIHHSTQLIKKNNIQSIQDVRSSEALIVFSDAMHAKNQQQKRFLRENLYLNYRVQRMALKSKKIIKNLFDIFMLEPVLLPKDYQVIEKSKEVEQARRISDYIAGMTDRYAILQYKSLFAMDVF